MWHRSKSTMVRSRRTPSVLWRGLLAGLAVLTIAVSVGTSPARSDSTARSVLFVNPGFREQGFWKSVSDTMQAAATALDFQLTIVSGDRKWPLMLARGREALETGRYDYAILVNEHQQAPDLMRLADRRGIRTVLLLNSLTAEQEAELGGPRERLPLWLGSLTPDNEIAGFEMARSLARAGTVAGLADDGQIALLTLAGDFKTPASIHRLAGLDRGLQAFDSLVELRRLTVNWSEAEAYARTRLWLKGHTVEAIWAANDPIAFGATRALTEAGHTPGKDVVVAGLNWSFDAIEMVRDGRLTITHGGHFLAGAWVMILLYDVAHGVDFADIGPHLRFPMSAIDRTNADTYLAKLGQGDWSRINFKAFSRVHHPQPDGYDFTLSALLEVVE